MMIENNYNRMEYIDSVRGISCILVYICHWYGTLGGGNPNFLGKTGVGFLFALSGYCLMGIYHETQWTPGKLIYFYIKRFSAVYPCLLITLAMALFLNYCEWFDVITIMKLRHGIGHFWTISVNIIFYLLFPAISYIIQKIGIKRSIGIIWMLLFGWAFYYIQINASKPIVYVPMCVAGILVYLYKETSHGCHNDKKDCFFIIPVVIFTLAGFVMYSIPTLTETTIETTKILAGTIVCSFCLYFIVTRNYVKAVLSDRRLAWLHYIGRISYEIYLTHLIILAWILNITSSAEKHALASETIISTCLTIMCSVLLYTFIQQPINKILVRVIKPKILNNEVFKKAQN